MRRVGQLKKSSIRLPQLLKSDDSGDQGETLLGFHLTNVMTHPSFSCPADEEILLSRSN
jgi:hypothetical protein